MRLPLALLFASAAFAQSSTFVSLDGQNLWDIRSPRAGFSPAERARDTSESLLHVADDPRIALRSARQVDLESESLLLMGRVYLFSVTEADAQAEGRARADLFAERRQIALTALARYRDLRSARHLLRSAALAAGALLLAAVILWVLRRLYRQSAAWAHRRLGRHAESGGLAPWLRVFEKPLLMLLRGTLRLLAIAAAVVVISSSLGYALSLFPATSTWAETAKSQVLHLLADALAGVLGYLPNLLVLLLIGLFTYLVIRASRRLAHAIDAGTLAIPGFHAEWAHPTYGLAKVLIVLFALVVAFPYLPGGESPALKGASIFVGVLVSLGSGSAMGNIVAGVILTYMRPYRVGDRVQIADSTGDVIEKSLLVTRVRTIKNVEVIVPNSAILGAHILNYSANARQHGLILHTTVTLGYNVPWRQVHQLMIAAALRTEGILAEPQPFVLQTGLNDSHISYELNAYTAQAHRMQELYSALHRHLQDEFAAAGLEIMSPMYLAVRDGNPTTVPSAPPPSSAS